MLVCRYLNQLTPRTVCRFSRSRRIVRLLQPSVRERCPDMLRPGCRTPPPSTYAAMPSRQLAMAISSSQSRRVHISPFAAGHDAFQMESFQVAVLSGLLSDESALQRRPEVCQPAYFIIFDFAAFAADQDSWRSDTGEILVAGEVVDPESAAEVQRDDGLAGFNDPLLLRRAAASGSLDQRRFESDASNDGVFKIYSQEAPDEAHAVIVMRHRDLRLGDGSKPARLDQIQPRRVDRLERILFGHLNPGGSVRRLNRNFSGGKFDGERGGRVRMHTDKLECRTQLFYPSLNLQFNQEPCRSAPINPLSSWVLRCSYHNRLAVFALFPPVSHTRFGR